MKSSKPHDHMKAKSGPSQQQASILFSPYYNRLDMKQAWASVSLSMDLISCLLSVHMALFFLDGNPRKERAAITGGLSSLAMLTTPLMAVMQLTRLLSVSARGDSRSFQQSRGKNRALPSRWQLSRGQTCLSLKVLVEINAIQTHFLLHSWNRTVRFPGKRVRFVLKAMLMSLQSDRVRGRVSSTAGSAKPCLSPLCPLSTFRHISAMWSCWADDSFPAEALSVKPFHFLHPLF